MASPFDQIQRTAWETVGKTFAEPASWTPSTGGAAFSANVFFKNPTEELRLAGVEYDPAEWQMEYLEGDFPGLKGLVDSRDSEEVVDIDGTSYYIKAIDTVYDGKTYRASLQPVE